MAWLLDEKREGGPEGFIGFAISARMTAALRQSVEAVPEQQRQDYGKTDPDVFRDCAEVPFVPTQTYGQKDGAPPNNSPWPWRMRMPTYRSAGSSAPRSVSRRCRRHDWTAAKLLQWHREKAGTIEGVHHVLKNELAAGVLPCGRFGANAAWLRLAILTHNVLTALKRLALPPELLAARPKRLRFLFFHTAGRLVNHARKLFLRLARAADRLAVWRETLRLLPLPS